MPIQRPSVIAQSDNRVLACAPTALLAFIVNEDEEFLMLSSPESKKHEWEVINGMLEHDETLLDGLLREIHEEAGDHIQVRPLCVIHNFSFPYDATIQNMHCICYLFAYEGGMIDPGDDMVGSLVRWASLDEIEQGYLNVIVPAFLPWVFRRTLDLFRLLKDSPPVMLQPSFEMLPPHKYVD